MKKRILSMLLTLLVVFSFMPPGNASASIDKTDAENATAFVESLIGSVTVAKENVTRAEFVGAMAKVFKLDTSVQYEQFFEDVSVSNEYASAIRQACELGWISYADAFRPTNAVTYSEAVKIAVSAMGYDDVAQAQGGYPTGYFWVANKIGITDRLSMTDDLTLTKDELMIFIENMMNAKIAKLVGNGIMTTYSTEETLMKAYYDIYKIKGIIDATKHSSLTSETDEFPRDMISINGVSYYYDGYSDDYLGYNVHAYCRYDEETDVTKVVYLKFLNNEVYEYSTGEYSGFANGKIKFDVEDGKTTDSYKVEDAYTFVYNGKKMSDKSDITTLFKDGNGFIKLVDNDADGVIEVISLDDYKYIYVSEVDGETETIADNNSGENNVVLEDTEYVIYNENGEEVGFEDIKIGSVVAVAVSKDSKIAKLILCDGIVSGSPSSYGSDGIAVFDGVEYEESPYFKKYYGTSYNKNEGGVYYLGINNHIVAYSAVGTKMTYGYVIQAQETYGIDSTTKMKLLNDSGKVVVMELADRVMVDGVWKKSSQYDASVLIDTLIKYDTKDGKIKHIDTPEELTLEAMYKENSYDSMTKSDFPSTANGKYRNTGVCFENGYYVSKAVVFVIDTDDVEYGSKVGNYNYLESGETYTGEAMFYDIDGVGFAGAVVTTKDLGSALGASATNGSVIHSVTRAIDNEGEECYKVRLMTYQGLFKTYYMDYSLMPVKSSGKILGFGDIVKIIVDVNDTRILGVSVMYDGENMRVENSTYFDESTINNNNFRQGIVYNYNNNHIAYSNTQNTDGTYKFELSTLKYQSVNTTNLVTINREDETIRKGYQDDFKSYRDYEDKASRVVVMYNFGSCSGVFIYEN